MVDHQMYRRMHPSADAFMFDKPQTHLQYDRWPDTIAATEAASNNLFILFPPDTYGFYLTEKKWGES